MRIMNDIDDPIHGHCDTCGARCDQQGCTANRKHPAAIGSDDIVRTVFTIEVLSRGGYEVRDDDRLHDLQAIAEDITEGDCIGDVTWTSAEVVPPDKVQEHLVRIGNDGSFFNGVDEPVLDEPVRANPEPEPGTPDWASVGEAEDNLVRLGRCNDWADLRKHDIVVYPDIIGGQCIVISNRPGDFTPVRIDDLGHLHTMSSDDYRSLDHARSWQEWWLGYERACDDEDARLLRKRDGN